MKDRDLPAEMQGMSTDEREKYVQEISQKRQAIQEQIMELYKEREAYIAAQKELNKNDNALGDVLISALREQAEMNGFTFEE